jgi:hypothetical protein
VCASLRAAKGDNWRQIASDKKRHIATNSLPFFVARFRAAFFPNELVRRWCLPENCPKKADGGLKKCPCKLVVKEENREKATLVAGKKPNEKSQIV